MELTVRPDELRSLATSVDETRARLDQAEAQTRAIGVDVGHHVLADAIRRFGAAWTSGLAEVQSQLEAASLVLRTAADAYADTDRGLASAFDGVGPQR